VAFGAHNFGHQGSYNQFEGSTSQLGSQQWGNDELVQRLRIVGNAMPRLRKAPKMLLSIAQMPVESHELVKAVRDSELFDRMREVRASLEDSPAEMQERNWRRLGTKQKALLRQVGYRPGAVEPGGGGFFDNPIGFVPVVGALSAYAEGNIGLGVMRSLPGGEVLRRTVWHGEKEALNEAAKAWEAGSNARIPGLSWGMNQIENAAEPVGDVAGYAFQKMDTGGKAISHLYRFLKDIEMRHGTTWFFEPSRWDDIEFGGTWEKTGRAEGEGYWAPHTHRELRAIMPKDDLARTWVKELAMGNSVADIANRYGDPGTPGYQAAYKVIDQRTQDKDFQEAHKLLELGKVSFGRTFAEAFGLDPEHDKVLYNYMSGSLDMGLIIFGDPTLFAGKLMKGYRAARWGIAASSAPEGIAAARGIEEARMVARFGDDWVSKIAEFDAAAGRYSVPIREIVGARAYKTAMAERIARSYRQGVGFVADADGVPNGLVADLYFELPHARRATDTLRNLDQSLRIQRARQIATTEGRFVHPDEIAQLPGITGADEIWDLWSSRDGALSLARGEWGTQATKAHFEIPQLTYGGLAKARTKMWFKDAIDFGAAGGAREIMWGLDDDMVVPAAQLRKAGKPVPVNEVLDEVAPGKVRLYQVRAGPKPENGAWRFSTTDNVHADRLELGSFWSDDLDYARAASRDQGGQGTLYALDVDPAQIQNVPEIATAGIADSEFTLLDDVLTDTAREVGQVGDWVEVQGKMLWRPLRIAIQPPANFVRSLTRRVPENMVLPTHGPGFAVGAERILDMGISSPAKRVFMQKLLTASNDASRRQIMHEAIDYMFRVNGVYATEGGREEALKYLSGLNQMYAREGIDARMVNGTYTRSAVDPVADHADGFVVPSMRDVFAQSQRASVIRAALGGINNSWTDAFMGTYWKPSVLMRFGFIPRAAGEEMLAHVLRFPSLVPDKYVWRPLVKSAQTGDPLWVTRPLRAAANWNRHFVTQSYSDHLDEMAESIFNRADGWIRGMAERRLEPGELRVARQFIEHPYLQRSYSHSFTEIGGTHTALFDPDPNMVADGKGIVRIKITPDGEVRYARTIGSRYQDYLKSHEAFEGQYSREIQRVLSSPVADAYNRVGLLEVNPEVLRAINTPVHAEVAAQLAATRGLLGDPDDAELIAMLRHSVDELYAGVDDPRVLETFRPLMNAWQRTLKTDEAARAKELTNIGQRMMAFAERNNDPALQMIATLWPELNASARASLMASEDMARITLGLTPTRSPAEMLNRALTNVDPVPKGFTRYYTSSGITPEDWASTSAEAMEQIQFWPNPQQALQASLDGRPAGAGFQVYYLDVADDAPRVTNWGDNDELLNELQRSEGDLDSILAEIFDVPIEMLPPTYLDDIEQAVTAMRPVPGFMVPGDTLGEADQLIVEELFARARQGDVVAAGDLRRRAVRRSYDMLSSHQQTARYINEWDRALLTTTGKKVLDPLPQNHGRVWVIVADPKGATLQDAADAQSAYAKAVLANRVEPGQHQRLVQLADHDGGPAFQPWSRQSFETQEDAMRALREVAGESPMHFGIGYVDVHDTRLARESATILSDSDLAGWQPVDLPTAGQARSPFRVEGPDTLSDDWADWRYWESQIDVERARSLEDTDELEFAKQMSSDAAERLAVRGYDVRDAGARGELGDRFGLEARQRGVATPQQRDAAYGRLVNGDYGRVYLETSVMPTGMDHVYVHFMTINEGERGAAENFRLMRRILDDADDAGVTLYADSLNDDTWRMYQRAGFELNREPGAAHFGDDFDDATEAGIDQAMNVNEDPGDITDLFANTDGIDVQDAIDRGDITGNVEYLTGARPMAHGRPINIRPMVRYPKEPGMIGRKVSPARKVTVDDELQKAFDAWRTAKGRQQVMHAQGGPRIDPERVFPGVSEAEAQGRLDESYLLMADWEVERAANDLDRMGFDMTKVEDRTRLETVLADRIAYATPPPDPRPVLADALDEAADVGTAKYDQLLTSPVDGRYLPEVGGRFASQGRYDLEDLVWDGPEQRHIPEGVNGPEFFHPGRNAWEKLQEKFFGIANAAITSVAREPIFYKMFSRRHTWADSLIRPHLEDTNAFTDMLDLASRTQGGQADVLAAYRQIWEQLPPQLRNTSKWSGAAQQAELELAFESIKLPFVSDTVLAQVKRHMAGFDGDEIAVLRRWTTNQRYVDETVTKAALEGAVQDVIPFIDDHKLKSQFAEGMRNLAPFFFAEEQMLKRWARVLKHSPEVIRRAQLLFMGLSHSGIIRTNDFGQKVWTIPGSAVMQDLLSNVAEPIFGEQSTIPLEVPFTGDLRYTLPGINRAGVPSFGPMVGVPMNLLARRFPELRDPTEQLLGPEASGRSVWDQIIPTSVMRFWKTIHSNAGNDAQFASATIQAMANLEAAGKGIGPDATTDEIEVFTERVENWTRTLLLNRAIFGFFSPAAPQIAFEGKLDNEYQELLSNLPFEEAIATFIERHPDATSMTVFQTGSPSGASMPTTPEVGRFLDTHGEFTDKYKMAVPWLFPQAVRDDDTSRSVYARQVQMGLRVRKSPYEWWEDYAFAAAAPEYFNSKDVYDRDRYAFKDNPDVIRQLDANWSQWKQKYYAQFPKFAEQLQSRDAAKRRAGVIDEMERALADPDLPASDIKHLAPMRVMMESYRVWTEEMAALSGNRTDEAEDARAGLRTGFVNWGQTYIKRHGALAAFWQRNILPDIGLDYEAELALGLNR
jgi:hypothetical protein